MTVWNTEQTHTPCAECDEAVRKAINLATVTGTVAAGYGDNGNHVAHVRRERVQCEWFALCINEATTTRPHPILGPVPICEQCNERVDALEGDAR